MLLSVPMRVLLISPLPRLDPTCGDVTYTETLLSHPPEGVQFETYAQALESGALREHGNRRAIQSTLAIFRAINDHKKNVTGRYR